MKHVASPDFWNCYHRLPRSTQILADKNFKLLKTNQHHSSLRFKTIGKYRSVRVGIKYRALGIEIPEGILWFWIGSHAGYDRFMKDS